MFVNKFTRTCILEEYPKTENNLTRLIVKIEQKKYNSVETNGDCFRGGELSVELMQNSQCLRISK